MSGTREIGGYLELERFAGEPYHVGAIALNSGRACLEYLIELRGIKTIWLPDWLCDSVCNACLKRGLVVNVYAIGSDMRPVFDFSINEGDYLYLVDYYGQLNDADVASAKAFSNGRLILDEAQAFFVKPREGVDTLYTCRKFFGVADGAYLYSGDGSRLLRELPKAESFDHMGFVLGRYERSAGEFFAESKVNNKRFADEPVRAMSSLTENLMRAIDYDTTKKRREENARYLHERLAGVNLLKDFRIPPGAFMYPLLVGDVEGIRGLLAQRGLFIPTLWPNCLEGSVDNVSTRYSRDILPLPVDQRYGLTEMERIVVEVKKHMEQR